jgi:hypothetical protein
MAGSAAGNMVKVRNLDDEIQNSHMILYCEKVAAKGKTDYIIEYNIPPCVVI